MAKTHSEREAGAAKLVKEHLVALEANWDGNLKGILSSVWTAVIMVLLHVARGNAMMAADMLRKSVDGVCRNIIEEDEAARDALPFTTLH